MKLEHLFEQEKKGTYAGVHFTEDTKKRIAKFIKDNNIPNGVPTNKLHTTILYSRKHLPNYEPQGKISPVWIGKPKKFVVWQTKPTDKYPEPANALILKYDCPECVKRHKELMKEHDAEYDYDVFRTHVTLSYNIGDMDIKDLPDPSEIGDIKIDEEYHEDLNLNWADDNT